MTWRDWTRSWSSAGSTCIPTRRSGLLKSRHYPVVVAMLDDLLELTKQAHQLDAADRRMIEETRTMRDVISSGQPLPLDNVNYPAWKSFQDAKNLQQIPGYVSSASTLALACSKTGAPDLASKAHSRRRIPA
jgi:hypothetical protein